MKQRVLVAVVGVPALLAILCVAPHWATALLLMLLSVIAAHELLTAVSGVEKARRWTVLPAITAVLVLLWGLIPSSWLGLREILLLAAAFALPIAGVLSYGREHSLSFTDLCAMAVAGFVIPYAFRYLYLLRTMDGGFLLVLVPLVAAFCSDTMALFTGMACGKHKLAPRVSPNKTVEGSIGGLLGGVIGMLLFGLIYRSLCARELPLWLCALLGLAGAVMGQLGDLSFSMVKRQVGIKDYGRLLPGHGGVLDRFDSVLFAAPVVYTLLLWL